jgi:cyanophycin synthetase
MPLCRPATLARWLYRLHRLGTLRPRPDRSAREVERLRGEFCARVWREAAEQLGAEFEDLGCGIFEVRRGGVRTRVRDSWSAIDDPVTLEVAGHKALVYRLLAREGLPIPHHRAFWLRDLDDAAAFLKEAGRDCVVKPASGTAAGRGVTTGIRRVGQLIRAAAAAAVHGELLIEDQVAGDNYRLLYLDGVLLDAVVRRPPAVTGDGVSTVRQLLEEANATRLAHGAGRSQVLLTPDLDMAHTLARHGLTPGSVPPAGAIVTLKTVINQNFGPDNATATDRLCDSVVEAGARAARAVGVRLAGVDLITPDPSRPLAEAGGVVLEVNTTPGFHHHYHKSDGSFPVAVRVLEELLGKQTPWGTFSTCPEERHVENVPHDIRS